MTKKMFKGCPYEQYLFYSCEACPLYRDCCSKMRQRQKIRARRRAIEKLKKVLMTISVFCMGTFALCMLIGIISSMTVFSAPKADDMVLVGEKNTYEEPYKAEEISFEIASKKEIPADISVVNIAIAKEIEAEHWEFEEIIEETIEEAIEETVGEVVEVPTELYPNAYWAHDVYIYDLSYEDMVYIAKVVWAEARGESLEGKVAVAAVILNRYFYGENEPFNRDSIYSVVTQSGAFASIRGVTMRDLDNVPECMYAVELACKGWDPTREMFPETGAMYFYNPAGVSGYQKRVREGIEFLKIGAHNFHNEFNVEA